MILPVSMIYITLVVLGLCFGSFINALVWRMRQQEIPKRKRVASLKELSITKGRSMCPHCQHTLAWYDLLPVLSWTSLGGKCRYCKQAISPQYPTVELMTSLLFIASYNLWPVDIIGLQIAIFGIWLTALIMLVALAVYDIRWMLLPNKLVFPLTGLGALTTVIMAFDGGGMHSLLMSLAALGIAGGIFYVLFQISDGTWIGGGDVKLGFAIGLLLGRPELALLMLFTASLLGLVFTIPGLIARKSKLSRKIPFGPFLIAATIIVKLFGLALITWYESTFLYL